MRKTISLILLGLLCSVGNVWGDETTTFDFTGGSTTGLTIAKSGTVANVSYSITNDTYNTIPTLSDGNYFLGVNFTSNSAGILDVTTTNSFTNIKSISFDCAADNNSNPKVAIYIVDAQEKETEVQAAMVMSSGSTKVWRSKKDGVGIYTIDLSSSLKTGKVHFKFTTGSSGKSGAIDNIVITTAPATAYTVTFDANTNGTCATESLTEASAGAGVTLPAVTPNSGYAFNGWYDDDSDGDKVGDAGDTYHPTSNITVYAQYSNLYTVTYALNGGTGTTPTQDAVTAGTEITLHNGTTGITAPESKAFAGWLCSVDEEVKGGGASYTMTAANTAFTAQWKTPNDATFTNGSYVVGSSALDLGSLFSSSSTGIVTYTVKNANGTSAAIDGTSFTATAAGTATITATQAATATYAGCEIDATITVTYPATGSATITYVLDVTNGGTTLQTITGTEATSSSISVSTSNTLLAGGLTKSSSKGTHNGTRTLGINTLAEETADKYFYVTFTIADGYEITPSAISLKVLTIGGNATSYKAVLTDGNSSITGTVDATNDSEKTLAGWSGLGTTTLSGTVTLKLYAWYTTSGSYNAYRLSTPITISGTVAMAIPVCPSGISISGNNEYYAEDDIELTAALEEGNGAITYQWYKDGLEDANELEGETSSTLTIASCGLGDAGSYYCVASKTSCSDEVSAAFPVSVIETPSRFLFSSKVAATTAQSIAAGASGLELTASQATVTGGHMYVYNGQSEAKDLIAKSGSDYYFCETNNNTFFKISLNNALAAGDIITIDVIGGDKDGNAKGVWVSTADSKPGSAPACSGTSSTTSLVAKMVNYTVTSTDEYVGKSNLYIYRAVSATQYFGDIRITRPYTRSVTSGNWGTICLPYAVTSGDYAGATFYSIAGKRVNGSGDPTSIVLSEETGALVAGRPYIFQATSNKLSAIYSGDVASAGSNNGLIGSIGGTSVDPGMYLLSSGTIVKAGTGCSIAANRAYINMTNVPVYDGGGSAPGIREIPMAPTTPTSVENIDSTEKAVKFVENGQILILRDGITYDVMGRVIR